VQGKCNHGPNATCIHCSKTIKEQTKGRKTGGSRDRGAHAANFECNGGLGLRLSVADCAFTHYPDFVLCLRAACVAVHAPRHGVLSEMSPSRIGRRQRCCESVGMRLRPQQGPRVFSLPGRAHQANHQGSYPHARTYMLSAVRSFVELSDVTLS
jgi:hypothetical protein